jgi:hypothetical protein
VRAGEEWFFCFGGGVGGAGTGTRHQILRGSVREKGESELGFALGKSGLGAGGQYLIG